METRNQVVEAGRTRYSDSETEETRREDAVSEGEEKEEKEEGEGEGEGEEDEEEEGSEERERSKRSREKRKDGGKKTALDRAIDLAKRKRDAWQHAIYQTEGLLEKQKYKLCKAKSREKRLRKCKETQEMPIERAEQILIDLVRKGRKESDQREAEWEEDAKKHGCRYFGRWDIVHCEVKPIPLYTARLLEAFKGDPGLDGYTLDPMVWAPGTCDEGADIAGALTPDEERALELLGIRWLLRWNNVE